MLCERKTLWRGWLEGVRRRDKTAVRDREVAGENSTWTRMCIRLKRESANRERMARREIRSGLGDSREEKSERRREHRRERSCQGESKRCREHERDALGGEPAPDVAAKRESVDGGE